MFGKNDKKKKVPELKKSEKKEDSIVKRIKGLLKQRSSEGAEKKPKRTMPKPKPNKKVDLRPKPLPPRRPPTGIPEADKRTLIGAAVIACIIIFIAVLGYWFLYYQPYQEALESAKAQKIAEVNAYYKGPLATDPRKQALLAQIESATTPEEVLAIDVLGPATQSWRTYQLQQIQAKKDMFNRVMIVYSAGNQSTTLQTIQGGEVIMRVPDAQRFVSQADASVLSNIEIQTPDTVAIPILINRLQAAGGLIGVGSSVDIYLTNVTNISMPGGNVSAPTNKTAGAEYSSDLPLVSGATVLAILRSGESGKYDVNLTSSKFLSSPGSSIGVSTSRGASGDIEKALQALSAGGLSESDVSQILQHYGIRLSEYERVSNIGEFNATYLLIIEVPRKHAPVIMMNMDKIMLVVPTQKAPEWMAAELKKVYS